jgi:hypothetical protein
MKAGKSPLAVILSVGVGVGICEPIWALSGMKRKSLIFGNEYANSPCSSYDFLLFKSPENNAYPHRARKRKGDKTIFWSHLPITCVADLS